MRAFALTGTGGRWVATGCDAGTEIDPTGLRSLLHAQVSAGAYGSQARATPALPSAVKGGPGRVDYRMNVSRRPDPFLWASESKSAAMSGIESVKKNAGSATVDDQTD